MSTDSAPATWTHFWDMHSGGSEKLDWSHIFIEAPQEQARKMFMEAFGRDPENVTCNCCGDDYSVTEGTLQDMTGFHRHLRYTSPLSAYDGSWQGASTEERIAANRVARYLEPGEPVPEGWTVSESSTRRVDPNVPELSFEDFLADPHFPDFGGRRKIVFLLAKEDANVY